MDDAEGFSAYVAALRSRLVRTAVLIGCPPADAEDLVQATLVRCLRSWSRVRHAQDREAYVAKVLLNALRDARSRRWTGEVPSAELPEDAPDNSDLTTGLAVRAALARLEHGHREVLVLRYFADLSEKQAAEVLGVAVGTVKSRTSRALTALSATAEIADLTDPRRA